MEKIKSFFANIKKNWKGYIGVIAAIATAVLPFVQEMLDFGIGVQVAGVNIVPFVAIITSAIIAICGIASDGIHGKDVREAITNAKNLWKATVQAQKQSEAQQKAVEQRIKQDLAKAEKLAKEAQAKQQAELDAKKKEEFEKLVQQKLLELEAQKQAEAVIEAVDAKPAVAKIEIQAK